WSGPGRSPHSTMPPCRPSRIRRMARPPAASTARASRPARNHTVLSSSVASTQLSGPACSGPVASGPELCPEEADLGGLLAACFALRGVEGGLCVGPVYVLGQQRLPGQHGYLVIRDRQEAPADRGDDLPRGVLGEDPHQAALGQDAQHGRMAGQDADVTVQGLGDDLPGFPGPDLALRRDQRHVKRHDRFSSSLAFFSTSSIPPTMKNACSGRWSYLPSVIALNEEMVSSSGTVTPGWLVNCSATYIGCDRKRSIRRARCTVTLA